MSTVIIDGVTYVKSNGNGNSKPKTNGAASGGGKKKKGKNGKSSPKPVKSKSGWDNGRVELGGTVKVRGFPACVIEKGDKNGKPYLVLEFPNGS